MSNTDNNKVFISNDMMEVIKKGRGVWRNGIRYVITYELYNGAKIGGKIVERIEDSYTNEEGQMYTFCEECLERAGHTNLHLKVKEGGDYVDNIYDEVVQCDECKKRQAEETN